MRSLVFFIALLFVVSAFAELSNEEKFKLWMVKYNKKYDTEAEYTLRFNVFKNNLENYAELNANDDTVKHGPTKFSDLTNEEFKEKYLIKNFTSPKIRGEKVKVHRYGTRVSSLPVSYTWVTKNATTPIYNQEQCGSCWAFSTTESIESMNFLAGNPLVSLSMQQIVDCDKEDGGCNGGNPPTAYDYVIKAGGLESYADYPYTARNGICKFDPSKVIRSIKSWQYVTEREDEGEMQEFTYTTGPPSVCVDASTWNSYNGGVYTSSNCGTQLDHCVQIVGWTVKSGMNAWIVRNSWGTDWGYEGYCYVAIGQDACGIAQECTSAIVN
jgi:cathepsin F